MIQAQYPDAILHPFLSDKDVRSLGLPQSHGEESVVVISIPFGPVEPVIPLVPLGLADSFKTVMHGQCLRFGKRSTEAVTDITSSVPAVDKLFIDDIEQFHQSCQAHHPLGIFLVVNDDARHEAVGRIVKEVMNGTHAESGLARECYWMKPLESISSIHGYSTLALVSLQNHDSNRIPFGNGQDKICPQSLAFLLARKIAV